MQETRNLNYRIRDRHVYSYELKQYSHTYISHYDCILDCEDLIIIGSNFEIQICLGCYRYYVCTKATN